MKKALITVAFASMFCLAASTSVLAEEQEAETGLETISAEIQLDEENRGLEQKTAQNTEAGEATVPFEGLEKSEEKTPEESDRKSTRELQSHRLSRMPSSA